MTIADIREALAAAIEATGVKATAYVTDQVNTPQAVVRRGELNYSDSFDGEARYDFTITVYATREARAGQEYLDALVEPEGFTSMKAAVENDTALKEHIHYATVTRASPVNEAVVGETQYLAVDFSVLIIA